MHVRIAVAAPSFVSGFGAQVFSHLKKSATAGQSLVECPSPQNSPEVVRARLLAALEDAPAPAGLIVICFRPETRRPTGSAPSRSTASPADTSPGSTWRAPEGGRSRSSQAGCTSTAGTTPCSA
jgi:hypothetical protein